MKTTDHREYYFIIFGISNDFRAFPVSTEQLWSAPKLSI